jgi:hypothetical protein
MNGLVKKKETKMKTLEQQLTDCLADWTKLVDLLIPDIRDDYRASDDPDDETPAIQLTVGFTAETEKKDHSWNYQTGDNSFTGGAYGHIHWAVVSVTRNCAPSEVADEISEQIAELILN